MRKILILPERTLDHLPLILRGNILGCNAHLNHPVLLQLICVGGSADLYPLSMLKGSSYLQVHRAHSSNTAWDLFSPSQHLYCKGTGQGFYFSFTGGET